MVSRRAKVSLAYVMGQTEDPESDGEHQQQDYDIMDEILEEKEVMERQASLHNESDNLNTQNMLQTLSVKSESLKSGNNNQNSEKS